MPDAPGQRRTLARRPSGWREAARRPRSGAREEGVRRRGRTAADTRGRREIQSGDPIGSTLAETEEEAANGHRRSPPHELHKQRFRRRPANVCSLRLPPTVSAQQGVSAYTITGDTFTFAPGNSGCSRKVRSTLAIARMVCAMWIAAGFSTDMSPLSGKMNIPGASAGPMQVSSPRPMVNGDGRSVQVAALTVLDRGVGDSSAVGVTTSAGEQPARGGCNPNTRERRARAGYRMNRHLPASHWGSREESPEGAGCAKLGDHAIGSSLLGKLM